MTDRALVIGAGLTGLTAAHALTRHGWEVTVHEAGYVVGGHARSEWLHGVPYEPHGAHIFHTSDKAVWRLVTKLVPMLPYRHRVQTDVHGQAFSWPIQTDELVRLDECGRIHAELERLTGEIDDTNFETWCVSQMGETLYGLFIAGYTEKQWGRPGSQLSASMGPKRVELRTNGNRDLFTDPYQGWPAQGYGALAEALADDYEIALGFPVSITDIPELCEPGVPVIVTAALDDFCEDAYDPLEWRGVALEARWLPGVEYAQPCMVVNRPDRQVPFTRSIETKHALGRQAHGSDGTIVMYEYPGAPSKHYPVADADGDNARTQQAYRFKLRTYERNPLIPAGRLAHYTYINMDEAMREGLNVAASLVAG